MEDIPVSRIPKTEGDAVVDTYDELVVCEEEAWKYHGLLGHVQYTVSKAKEK